MSPNEHHSAAHDQTAPPVRPPSNGYNNKTPLRPLEPERRLTVNQQKGEKPSPASVAAGQPISQAESTEQATDKAVQPAATTPAGPGRGGL